MLVLDRISKSFYKNNDKIKVLENVSLELSPAEFVGIQGASGSGKTTLLLIAGGLLKPEQGQIFLTGKDLYRHKNENLVALRAKYFGFVFQQYHLIPYLTIFENILLPSLIFSEFNYKDRAFELIEKFGLEHRKNHIPAELSVGEKQRTALARALLHSPKIIFADEITGNLDAENSQTVVNALKDFSRSGGSVLFVTHDKTAATFADKTLYLKNGELLQE